MENRRGFTLVELTIATGLLGVLLAGIIVLINPRAQLNKTQDAKRKADLSQVQRALDLYYHDTGRYPPSTAGYRINSISWGSSWQPYMTTLPSDPVPTHTYIYNASSDGQSYWLYANLAQGAADPQACSGGNDCPNVPGTRICGSGSACNYGLSSSNVTP